MPSAKPKTRGCYYMNGHSLSTDFWPTLPQNCAFFGWPRIYHTGQIESSDFSPGWGSKGPSAAVAWQALPRHVAAAETLKRDV